MKPNRILQWIALGIGFLFLYIPIISLVVYSFNESKLVTVWTASRSNGTARCCRTTNCSTPHGCR